MPLKIQTTGLEDYATGGTGRLQVMVIGGPGAGKTRWSSYWPKPIYLNCEKGLSSIADRRMPYVNINNSQDMLDALAFLRLESRRPVDQRQYETVVVDTLDAFQRKVKDEWLQANPGSQSFRGFDAWGYLDTKMQMLLTRLLNLDMNVVVLVHYKDKIIREGTGENATERQELMLQLSGDVKDTAFNDFDLVGWMGTYWEPVDGQRVQKRGLTFKPTPDKPFLKDRLHVTPPWMEVTFSDEDYGNLFAAVISRLDELGENEVIGEIPSAVPEDQIPTGGVVGPHSGGALPAQDLKEVPLESLDKPTLQKMARELGIEYRNNTIKAELVAAIKQAREQAQAVADPGQPSPGGAAAAPAGEPTPAEQLQQAVAAAKAEQQQAANDAGPASGSKAPQQSKSTAPDAAPVFGEAAPATVVNRDDDADAERPIALEDLAPAAATTPVPAAPAPVVNRQTGEIDRPMTEQEIANALGGEVVSVTEQADPKPVPSPTAAPAASAPAAANGCDVCGKSLVGENQDLVKIGFIKFRMRVCNEHFAYGKEHGKGALEALKAA